MLDSSTQKSPVQTANIGKAFLNRKAFFSDIQYLKLVVLFGQPS